MELTLTLPDHVAAGFTDAEEAEAWLLAAAAEHAKAQALAVASDEAQAILRAAAAPFDGVEAPAGKTVPERVQDVEGDQVALRAQVRAVGVSLATAAGVDAEAAVEMIDQALGGSS